MLKLYIWKYLHVHYSLFSEAYYWTLMKYFRPIGIFQSWKAQPRWFESDGLAGRWLVNASSGSIPNYSKEGSQSINRLHIVVTKYTMLIYLKCASSKLLSNSRWRDTCTSTSWSDISFHSLLCHILLISRINMSWLLFALNTVCESFISWCFHALFYWHWVNKTILNWKMFTDCIDTKFKYAFNSLFVWTDTINLTNSLLTFSYVPPGFEPGRWCVQWAVSGNVLDPLGIRAGN